MIPNFEIFGKIFSVYQIAALCGVLCTLYLIYHTAEKASLDPFHALYMVLFSAIGVLIGGHVLYGITNFSLIVSFVQNIRTISSLVDFLDKLTLIFGGSVFYGGLLGGTIVGYVYLRKNRLPLQSYADLAAPFIPFFHTFGRIGCFLSGCCYGIPSKFGVVYQYAAVTQANGVRRFPIQLVEASLNFILFLVLFNFLKKEIMKGRLLVLYYTCYASYRFILEYFRGDEYRGFLFGFSTSQIISMILLLLSAGIWVYDFVKRPVDQSLCLK